MFHQDTEINRSTAKALVSDWHWGFFDAQHIVGVSGLQKLQDRPWFVQASSVKAVSQTLVHNQRPPEKGSNSVAKQTNHSILWFY